MKGLLGFLSFVLLAQGVGAIVHHFVGWFSLWTAVHRIDFLDGYELLAGAALLVLGLVVGGAAEKTR